MSDTEPLAGSVQDRSGASYPIPTTTASERIARRAGRPLIGGVPVKGDKTPVPCDDGTDKGFPGCPAIVTREYLAAHRRKQHGTRERRRPGRPPKSRLQPLQADDVVATVLRELFKGGLIPVDHLPAVTRWQEATITLFREIQGG